MGVPKFFRWISERYPKINQPIHCPPNPETRAKYFPGYNDDENKNDSSTNSEASSSFEKKLKKHQAAEDRKAILQKNSIIPEFDRLYLDMNGIIHCCSHNNAGDDMDSAATPNTTSAANDAAVSILERTGNEPSLKPTSSSEANLLEGSIQISEPEIFRNVCYYLDRIISDIVQPKELVYMAIDGVAPRAKMNQQRSRRYRSGKEKEIESTFYGAHLMMMRQKQRERDMELDGSIEHSYYDRDMDEIFDADAWDKGTVPHNHVEKNNNNENVNDDESNDDDEKGVKEVEPGRFAGTFETSSSNVGGANKSITDTSSSTSSTSTKRTSSGNNNDQNSSSDNFDVDYRTFLQTIRTENKNNTNTEENVVETTFHSNSITPGTPFFQRCTSHLQHFIQHKLHTDPKWGHLTILFSGPNVPGEGEHKIMQFIRTQKSQPDYNPNTRHCLFGQDGDLIMLGLASHEPHFSLLREEVIFDQARKRAAALAVPITTPNSKANTNGEDEAVSTATSATVSASLERYMHNPNFELLHMSVLRDYLSYEFETSDVIPTSPFHLEPTIDDFVFMTFFVGNDFLPHMPALDIGDEAFDLLFYAYKRNRYKWIDDDNSKHRDHPYLTNAGEITSGKRLESFLSELGRHEDPYYDNKKRNVSEVNRKIRKADEKAGRETTVPPDAILAAKEELDRERYREMLERIGGTGGLEEGRDSFTPVTSSSGIFFDKIGINRKKNGSAFVSSSSSSGSSNNEVKFKPESSVELEEGFLSRMGTLILNSLTPESNSDGFPSTSISPSSKDSYTSVSPVTRETLSNLDEQHMTDLKGRYYYDKFKFSPVDEEKHLALRKAYVEGLVWNLQYYYRGCVSWDWFYPYHYGPMLSDLVNIDDLLKDISFDIKESQPLKPYEQLLGCLPPSSAYLLPKPYRWLMKSSKSPIIDFYPESFTVDMNGKRWPWEAVVLLPFIDSKRLIGSVGDLQVEDYLTEEEKTRNEIGNALVFVRDESWNEDVEGLNSLPSCAAIPNCHARTFNIDDTKWTDNNAISKEKAVFRPELVPGTVVPLAGFPTLKEAPVQGLIRRKIGLNVFGMRSRYRTAVLQLDNEIPAVPSAAVLAPKFIGSTVYFRYPFLQEGFVTAVSDAEMTIRGKDAARRWTEQEAQTWQLKNNTLRKQYETGEGLTGSGGWNIPDSNATLSVRPLKEIQTMTDGSKVKVYARVEVEVPLIAALWSPSQPDPRFLNIPARLEKNPYRFANKLSTVSPTTLSITSTGSLKNDAISSSKQSGLKLSSSDSKSMSILPAMHKEKNDETRTLKKSTSILPPIPDSNTKSKGKHVDVGKELSILPPVSSTPSHRESGPHPNPLFNGIAGTSRGYTTHSSNKRLLKYSYVPSENNGSTSRMIARVSWRGIHHGNRRVRAVSTVAVASALFFSAETFCQTNAEAILAPRSLNKNLYSYSLDKCLSGIRGGDFEETSFHRFEHPCDMVSSSPPPLEFEHGTTTISFTFSKGIVAAVDSRASIGNFVGSKTVQKVLPVNKHIIGTMAGGAADCSFWIRKLQAEARLHELTEGRSITVARASRVLANALYANRGLDLSVGTMIMGFDDHCVPTIYYVDNRGTRIRGDMFAVGSGSTFALGVLDTERREDMTEEEAVLLGIKAIRHATFRDAFSGGYIAVYVITSEGWRKVFSEDLALSAENFRNNNEKTISGTDYN